MKTMRTMKFYGKMLTLMCMSMLLFLSLSCGGGGDSDPVPPTLELNPTNLTFMGDQSSQNSLSIKTDGSWEIISCPDWLQPSSRSGTGNTNITLTTTKSNESSSKITDELVVKATNEAGDMTRSVTVEQRPVWEEDCWVDVGDLKLEMCYGFACTVKFGMNTKYFFYNVYGKEEFEWMRGNSSKIYQEATKTNTSWVRVDIPSSGSPEIVYTGCEPEKSYVFVTLSMSSNGKQGDIRYYDFSTPKRLEQPLADVTFHSGTTVTTDEDGNTSDCYTWDVKRNNTCTAYYTYVCVSSQEFPSMKARKGALDTYDSHDGVALAWDILMEHKTNELTHVPTAHFNTGSGVRKEMLFGKYVNDGTMTFKADPSDKYIEIVTWGVNNDTRSGIVYDVVYSLDGSGPDYTLSLGSSSLSLKADGSEAKSVTVTSNDSWTVTSSDSWCTVTPASGSKNGSFSVKASANTSTTSRTATITVKGTNGGKQATVRVTQDGQTAPDISVSPSSMSFTASAGSKDATITASSTWTAQSNHSWCQLSATSGNGNKTITVSVDRNTTTSKRTATVTIKDSSNSSKTATISITQDAGTGFDVGKDGYDDTDIDLGKGDVLAVNKSLLQFDAYGGTQPLSLTGNDQWSATSSETWCKLSASSGTAPSTLQVEAVRNGTTEARTAVVTIKGTKSGKTFTVTVRQTAPGTSDVEKDDYPADKDLD